MQEAWSENVTNECHKHTENWNNYSAQHGPRVTVTCRKRDWSMSLRCSTTSTNKMHTRYSSEFAVVAVRYALIYNTVYMHTLNSRKGVYSHWGVQKASKSVRRQSMSKGPRRVTRGIYRTWHNHRVQRPCTPLILMLRALRVRNTERSYSGVCSNSRPRRLNRQLSGKRAVRSHSDSHVDGKIQCCLAAGSKRYAGWTNCLNLSGICPRDYVLIDATCKLRWDFCSFKHK